MEAHLCAVAIGVAHRWLNVVDKAALEVASENLLLMLHKGFGTLMLKESDGAGTQIHHLLVVVGNTFVVDAAEDFLFLGFIKESE